MKPNLITKIVVTGAVLMSTAFAKPTYEIIEVKLDNDAHYNKGLILNALQSDGNKAYSKRTQAIIMAIASIETEQYKVDYKPCDNKPRGACNVSVFKMNTDMITKYYQEASLWEKEAHMVAFIKHKIREIHGSPYQATFLVADMIQHFGLFRFLCLHRGGLGWAERDDHAIEEYMAAILKLADQYKKVGVKSEFRYTIHIPSI